MECGEAPALVRWLFRRLVLSMYSLDHFGPFRYASGRLVAPFATAAMRAEACTDYCSELVVCYPNLKQEAALGLLRPESLAPGSLDMLDFSPDTVDPAWQLEVSLLIETQLEGIAPTAWSNSDVSG